MEEGSPQAKRLRTDDGVAVTVDDNDNNKKKRADGVTVNVDDSDNNKKKRGSSFNNSDANISNAFEDLFEHADGKIGLHVFSFLLGGSEFNGGLPEAAAGFAENVVSEPPAEAAADSTDMKVVAKLQRQFSLVCRKWKRHMDKNLTKMAGLVGVQLAGGTAVFSIKWLMQYKFKLGWLRIGNAEFGDIALLIDFVKACDTQYLTHVAADFNPSVRFNYGREDECYDSPSYWFVNAREYSGNPLSQRDRTILQGYPTLNHALSLHLFTKIAWELKIPYVAGLTERDFYDVLADNCPCISHLEASLSVLPNENADRFISQALFSLPTITDLVLELQRPRIIVAADANDVIPPFSFDGMTVTKAIRNLSNLHHMKFRTFTDFLFYPEWGIRWHRFHIESLTLQTLDRSGLSYGFCISCKCPCLAEFRYSVKSGSLPRIQHPGWEKKEAKEFASHPFIGMDAPDSVQEDNGAWSHARR